MKFAIVESQRSEPKPGLKGSCPSCGLPMTAKCGEVRVWHWSHAGKRVCDPWWENETEWHRSWKNHFPVDWQEVVHRADSGEKHVADVKTDQGWVLEFQHSYLKPEERRSRDSFYKKIVWVVDGKRRLNDHILFDMTFHRGAPIGNNGALRKVSSDGCRILKEWSAGSAPVFFDFGQTNTLWWLLPECDGERNYVAAFPRDQFVHLHRSSSSSIQVFESFLNDFAGLIAKHSSAVRAQAQISPFRRIQPRRSFRM